MDNSLIKMVQIIQWAKSYKEKNSSKFCIITTYKNESYSKFPIFFFTPFINRDNKWNLNLLQEWL